MIGVWQTLKDNKDGKIETAIFKNGEVAIRQYRGKNVDYVLLERSDLRHLLALWSRQLSIPKWDVQIKTEGKNGPREYNIVWNPSPVQP